MLSPTVLLYVYCTLIVLASVMGGRLPKILRLTHLRTQVLISGVGGLMLGIAMLHLLPHAAETLGSASKMGTGALIGLIVMFLLIRVFHTHDHGTVAEAYSGTAANRRSEAQRLHGENEDQEIGTAGPTGQEHEHRCDHSSEHGHSHGHPLHGQLAAVCHKKFSWTGLFFGLALHTLVDGVALASSVMADAQHGAWLDLAGLGTFLAVALHKPIDAFAITSVMQRQNWSATAQGVANFSFSLACPFGAALFFAGTMLLPDSNAFLGWGLAVSAGFFIGIALADLLPEVAFHDHDRGKLTAALLAGVLLAWCIENLPGHQHSTAPDPPPGGPMAVLQPRTLGQTDRFMMEPPAKSIVTSQMLHEQHPTVRAIDCRQHLGWRTATKGWPPGASRL